MALPEASAHKLDLLTEISRRKNYRAFLYDCDGTLADNMYAHKAAFSEAALKYGIELDTAVVDEPTGLPTPLLAAEIGRRYRVAVNPAEFAREKTDIFFDQYIGTTVPVDFVVNHLVNHLGLVRIGVVSGGSRVTVSRTLELLGLISKVDVIVCAGETPRGKPYADPFIRAAKLLGIHPRDCLVFEDGPSGVQGAIAAGMDWVRIDELKQ